jgi:hypothetical protein
MALGLKMSMIVACLALGAAGCSQDSGRGMSPTSPMSTQTKGAVSNEDGTQQTNPAGGGAGSPMMQQCNVIKGRVASGVGLTDQMRAMIPQCERMLGTSLSSHAPGTAPSPVSKSY